jgi:hypothetical protein
MTHTTYYPSLDGRNDYADLSGVSWTDIHDAATGTDTGTTSAIIGVRLRSDANDQEWDYIGRMAVFFDTSNLAGESITAATLGMVGTSADPIINDFTSSLGLVLFNSASDTALVVADFNQFGTALQAPSINLASLSNDNSTYNTWTLDATGRGNISLSGITKFGLRISDDITGIEPTWVDTDTSQVFFHGRNETAGAELRPRLVVTHSTAFTPKMIMF